MNDLNYFKKLNIFPQSPGVYIFYGKNGKILYVGKAGSLKDRVGSYFQNPSTPPVSDHLPLERGISTPPVSDHLPLERGGGVGMRPIEMMIGEVTDIKIKKTDTVLEAYILEQNLIKKFQPKYNVDGKDDKSFSYVVVTQEDFPRFIILRGTELEFHSLNPSGLRPPPLGKGKLNPSGLRPPPLGKGNLNPSGLRPPPLGKGRIKGGFSRIYGPYISKKQIEIALKILRKIFPYHNRIQKTEKGCLDFQIGLCPGPYDGTISKKDYAKNIRGIKMILEGKKKGLMSRMKKEMEDYSAKNEFEKAAEVRNKIFALQHVQDVALIAERNPHPDPPPITGEGAYGRIFRIEGYDISNISGKYAVGSMVVFDNSNGDLQPNKSQYRKFKIKTVKGANDVGAMEEILIRRFRNNWPRPDLIILDGGAGHLNMARRVLRNYKIEIPLLAVAKGPKRKKLDRRSFGTVPKIAENTIESVRDEAHRFAIGYHRKIRSLAID